MPTQLIKKEEADLYEDPADRVQNKGRIYAMCLISSMGIFFFGFNQGVFNVCQLIILQLNGDSLSSDNGKTAFLESVMTGANPLGGLIGALMGTYILRVTGTLRRSFLLADIIGIIGTILLVVTTEYSLISIGRFIQGLAAGFSSSLVPIYIKEFSPIEICGRTGSFPQIGQKGGLLTSYLLGLALPTKHALKDGDQQDYDNDVVWRIVLSVPIIYCLIRIFGVFCFFRDDAPTEQLKQHHEEQLFEFLKTIYKEQHVKDAFSQALEKYKNLNALEHAEHEQESQHTDDEHKDLKQGDKINKKLKDNNVGENQIVKQDTIKGVDHNDILYAGNVEIEHKQPHPMYDEEEQMKDGDLTESQLEREEAEFEELEISTRARRNAVGMMVSFAVSFSGIDAIFYYSNKIFEDAGKQNLAIYFTIGIGVLAIAFSFIGMAFADKAGRRPLLVWGSFIMTVSIIIIVIGDLIDEIYLILIAIVIFMFGYNSTLGPVKWPAWVELMDRKWSSIAASSIFVFAFIIGVSFPYLVKAINLWGSFLIFFGLSFCSFVYLFIELKETKGKNARQIYKMYSREYKEAKKPPKFSTNAAILEMQGMSAFGLRGIQGEKRLDMASIHKSFHKSLRSLHGQSIHGLRN